MITLVELRRHAAPHLLKLASLDEATRPVAEARMYREVMDQLIDGRLIARRARMASIVVTASEIDAALDSIAQANHLSREALLADDPETFYVTKHYANHPVVLVRLGRLHDDQLRDLLAAARKCVLAHAARKKNARRKAPRS